MARTRYQKGSVLLRGKSPGVWVGRWREDVVNGAGETRRTRRSQVLGTKAELPTQRLAQRRLDLILARINAPAYRPGRMATVEEFAERWVAMVLVNHKPSSQRVAKIHLRRFILPRLGRLRLDQLSVEVQQGFVTWLANGAARSGRATLSRKYTLNVMATLWSMLRTAAAWQYVCEPVRGAALSLPQEDVRRPARYFTADEARRILAAAGGVERVLYTVALLTGMRAGELLGLQRGDLDFERRVIHIRRSVWRRRVQTPKSRHSMRPVPMPEALAAVLQEHLTKQAPNSEGWLFANRKGKPMDAEHVVDRRLHPLLDALGMARCGLHAFRHTHCSLLVDAGVPVKVVQEQMRHGDVRTTMEVYAHAAVHAQRGAVEKVAAVLAPNGPEAEAGAQWVH